MTLDDLERRNSQPQRNFTELGSFRDGLRKSAGKYTKTFCSGNVGQQLSGFSDVSFISILAGDHPSESVKVRHSSLASENLTNNQP